MKETGNAHSVEEVPTLLVNDEKLKNPERKWPLPSTMSLEQVLKNKHSTNREKRGYISYKRIVSWKNHNH